jgi:hypothetical protein
MSQPIDPFQKFHETELKSVGVRESSRAVSKEGGEKHSAFFIDRFIIYIGQTNKPWNYTKKHGIT